MRRNVEFLILFCLLYIASGTTGMEEWETWPTDRLEQEMSPSRWNPNKPADEVINEYVQTSINDTQQARSSVPNELNIPYGNKPFQKYDVYGTDLPQSALTFVWLHGGYWQEGSKDISGGFANSLHSQGIRTIPVGYTLAPNATVKEIEFEIVSALENIGKRFPTANLVIGGHSAGGQLAAMLLHNVNLPSQISNKITGLLLTSGIYDLRPLVPTYVNAPLNLTRETAEASSPLRIREIANNFKKRASEFRILVAVGQHDPPVFHKQAEEYHALLKGTFANTESWESPLDDHFTLVQNMAKASSTAGKKLLEFMRSCNPTKTSGSSPSAPLYSVGSYLLNFLIHAVFILF